MQAQQPANSQLETRNSQLQTRDSKPATRNSKLFRNFTPVKPLFIILLVITGLRSFGQDLGALDSLKIPDPQLPDSLKQTWNKVDSIRNGFNSEAQKIQASYQNSLAQISQYEIKLRTSVDSLQRLNLPTGKVSRKLDSLNTLRQNKIGEVNGKINDLKSKTLGKLDKIEMTPGMEGPVGEFTQKINGYQLSDKGFAGIPAVKIPGYSLPEVGGLGDLTSTIQKAGNISSIETPLGDLGSVTHQVSGVSEDIRNISQGNLADVKQLPETIEQQALNRVEGLDELQKQSAVVDQYKEQLGTLNNPDALKEQAQTMVQKEAVNHFAGQEEALKGAMDKLAKYKSKYSSVTSLKDLPKRPPNAMKGKPFVVRLVPGIFFQVQTKGFWLVDVNPYTGYRISGRFTSGLGWNQRFAYDRKDNTFNSQTRIFGPRAFLDVGLGKGFIVHTETEWMNTYVPTNVSNGIENGGRQWVWSLMMGMKKSYKIYKNLNGTVLLQYNFVNKYFKTPYVDRLNSRVGFEYRLRKKQRKQ
jgi:hypothetical protein